MASFFEKLTGSHKVHEYEPDTADRESETAAPDEHEEGQLMVDAYHTPTHVVVHALVAGARPEDLDVSATREILTIQGKRRDFTQIDESSYFHKELYWGNFSRTILMPDEIDPEDCDVSLRNGVLTIKLAKLDKERVQKLRIKLG